MMNSRWSGLRVGEGILHKDPRTPIVDGGRERHDGHGDGGSVATHCDVSSVVSSSGGGVGDGVGWGHVTNTSV